MKNPLKFQKLFINNTVFFSNVKLKIKAIYHNNIINLYKQILFLC